MKYLKTYEDYEPFDDPFARARGRARALDDPNSHWEEVIGYGKCISLHSIKWLEPTLRGLIRDNVDFDLYVDGDIETFRVKGLKEYLIELKGDWQDKIDNGLFPSTDQDQMYISQIRYTDWYGVNWVKIDDVETVLDAEKYNL